MKIQFLALSIMLLFYGGAVAQEKADITKGKHLAKRCAWCHDTKRTLLAPSFYTILERYRDIPENQLKELIIKAVKDGSKGKWTKWMEKNIKTKLGKVEDMYMPSQRPYFTDREIKLIADWILSLRKELKEKK